jgi:uncharacterized protein YhdP
MRWFLRFRIFVIICFAVILITAAVLFSVLRAVLPYATGYKNEIQQELSQQIGLPVEINSIDAAIHWFSPRLKLIDVAVYDEKHKTPLFNFKEAFVGLDVIASIVRQEIIVDDVGLIGADISIEKLSEREWLVQGIKFTSEGSTEVPEQFLYMIQNSDYLLHDSNIYYQDHTGKKLHLKLLDVNIDVRNDFNNHDIRFSMNLPELYGNELAVVANLRGDFDSLEGDIYVEATQLNLSQWNKKFNISSLYQLDAVLDINLWSTIDKSKISSVVAQIASRKVGIKNKLSNKKWKTNYLSTSLRYLNEQDHWNLAVSDFYFGEKLKPAWGQSSNILASENGEFYFLSADMLRVSDLRKMAEVFLDKEQLLKLEKNLPYQIQADIYNLELQLAKDTSKEKLLDSLSLDASVYDFSILDKANNVELSGFDASLHYSDKQASIDIETQDAQVELKTVFRGPLFAQTIRGKIVAYLQGDSWRFSAEQLHLNNDHINTFSRFDI